MLGVVRCQVSRFDRFPTLPNLKVLILDHNSLDDTEVAKLVPGSFTALSLMDNRFQICHEQE